MFLPDFTSSLWQRQFFGSQFCFFSWVLSYGKVLRKLELAMMVYYKASQLLKFWNWRWQSVLLADSSCMRLLAWFPSTVRLGGGLCGCMDSLVRLTRWWKLCAIFPGRWGCRSAYLLCESSSEGPRPCAASWLLGYSVRPQCVQWIFHSGEVTSFSLQM